MTALLRLVCLTGLLMGAITISAAADQGRGDHDTPATERQDAVSPQLYNTRACRTDDYGWVVCRDGSGNWRRQEAQRRYRGYSGSHSINDWIWRLLH
jgi:hypothetical protein